MTQEHRMKEIGRNAWAILHLWADEFKAAAEATKPGCGCGDLAVQAMQGLHDRVNLFLEKPLQHPKAMEGLTAWLREGVAIEAQGKVVRKRDILGNPDIEDDDDEEAEVELKPKTSLDGLSEETRRRVWRARKRHQRAEVCKPGEEIHHPDYRRPDEYECVSGSTHRHLKHHCQTQMAASVYELVTGKILEQLRKGSVPWRKPWSTRLTGGSGMPRNAVSGRPYSGINFLLLSTAPYRDPRWLTFRQARNLGGTINIGEKSTLVTFWNITEIEDDQGEQKKRFLLRYYLVFNVEQCSGLHLKPIVVPKDFNPIAEAEAIFAGMPNAPPLDHKGGNDAYYAPGLDAVHLPPRGAFNSPHEYYSTAFHELGHSTGHKSRLARFSEEDKPAIFGSPVYSREELVAEFCSAFICATVGIDSTVNNSAAYIGGWMKSLHDDPKMVVFAASRGQRAADYILGRLNENAPKEATEAVEAAQDLPDDLVGLVEEVSAEEVLGEGIDDDEISLSPAAQEEQDLAAAWRAAMQESHAK